jgi:hypothetical protein
MKDELYLGCVRKVWAAVYPGAWDQTIGLLLLLLRVEKEDLLEGWAEEVKYDSAKCGQRIGDP